MDRCAANYLLVELNGTTTPFWYAELVGQFSYVDVYDCLSAWALMALLRNLEAVGCTAHVARF